MKLLILLVFFSLCSVARDVAPIAESDEGALLYSSYNLPGVMPPYRVERLLQHMVNATYNVGFRFIGDEMDFDHGHLLYEKRMVSGKNRLFPRAILYHTQEQAHSAHWKTGVDPKYDYLEVTARNWIQWLDSDPLVDGRDIVNARAYLDVSQKDPAPFSLDGAAPVRGQHYTIHSHNLDHGLLGFSLYGATQFRFENIPCNGSEIHPSSERGPIELAVDGRPVCLKLYTSGGSLIEDSVFRKF